MKTDNIVVRLNAEKHENTIAMFKEFCIKNQLQSYSLPMAFDYLLKENKRLKEVERVYKHELTDIKLSARETQKQSYMMLSVLNTFLYENEFGLSTPLFLTDNKTDMIRAVESNYNSWLDSNRSLTDKGFIPRPLLKADLDPTPYPNDSDKNPFNFN